MRALAVVLVLLLVPTAGAIFVPSGEVPGHGACDASGRLVCAGVDVGGTVTCATDAAGLAACTYRYGFLTIGYSPLGLPGSEQESERATLRTCSSFHGCTDAPFPEVHAACAWIAASSCGRSLGSEPATTSAQLALGDCLTVTVMMDADIGALVPDEAAPLATASYHNAGDAAGETCFVDNGR